MAYDGFLRYGGTEVANLERLAAYIENGLAPAGSRIDVTPCEDLSEVIYSPGWRPYRTPIQDEPPWYDGDDPDTWDFAGVFPLEVTGLDDTTRTVEVTQTLRGDGLPGRVQRTPQTIAVTALLVGRTTESAQAGLAWLRRALHGSCDADEQPCGPAATLEVFTVCPAPVSIVADVDEPQSDASLFSPGAPSPGDPEDWSVTNGTFTIPGDDGTWVDPYDALDLTDALDAGSTVDDLIDGGGAVAVDDLIDGGTSRDVGAAILGGIKGTCNNGPVTITWGMAAVDDPSVVVQMVLLDESGRPFEYGPKVDVTDDTVFTYYTWDLPFGIDAAYWRAGLVVTDRVNVLVSQVTAHPLIDPTTCIAPYRRFLPVTTTVSGPNVVETIDADCAVLLRVEWVWVSGSPFRYGVTDPVLLGLGWGEDPTFDALGVSWDAGDPPTLVSATPWNCAPLAPVAGCAIDPASPSLGTAPALPVVVDTTRPRITTQNVRQVWAVVGPEQVPANEGVLSIDLAAGADPVVGIRVRVWDDANADGTVPNKCDFAYEYLVDYVPENGVLTIDGTSNQVTTMCAGNAVPQDAAAGVRGDYGGPVKTPVVRCDRRYLVLVQWLDTYPRTSAPYYTMGDPNGDLTLNLYVTPREG